MQAEIEVDRSESVVTRKDGRTREVNENVDVRLESFHSYSYGHKVVCVCSDVDVV